MFFGDNKGRNSQGGGKSSDPPTRALRPAVHALLAHAQELIEGFPTSYQWPPTDDAVAVQARKAVFASHLAVTAKVL